MAIIGSSSDNDSQSEKNNAQRWRLEYPRIVTYPHLRKERKGEKLVLGLIMNDVGVNDDW